MSKRLTTSEFISRAKSIHGDTYSYDRSVYLGRKNKIEIICKKHGPFWQSADSHLSGRDCMACGKDRTMAAKRLGNSVTDIGDGFYEVDVSTKKHPNAKTIIDESSLPLIDNLVRWYVREDHGLLYVIRLENRKIKRLHRLISIPQASQHVDHVNGDTLDNRKFNLRNVNRSENQRNMSKSKANTSGVTGVCFDRRRKRWLAQIGGGKPRSFSEFDDAVAYRKKMERELGYHPNHGRDKVEH